LIAVNGEQPKRFSDYTGIRVLIGSTVTVERNGKLIDLEIPGNHFKRSGEPLILPMNYKMVVGGVPDSTGAKLCGMQKKDIIKKVAAYDVNNYWDLQKALFANVNETVSVEVERDGKLELMACKVDSACHLGFNPYFDVKSVYPSTEYTVGETFKYGIKEGWEAIYINAIGIGKMFTGEIDPIKSVQSPIGIAKNIYGGTWEWGRFWRITGLLSFILAFMNILPIPALDGGHMVFLGVEMLRGKPLSDKFLERAQVVGMLILLPLMILVMGKDIYEIVADWLGMIIF